MGLFGLGKPDVEKLKAKRDVNGLVGALNYTKDGQVAWAAMVALVQAGPAAIIPLRGAVYDTRSDHVQARRLAAIALGNLGDREAVPALKEGMAYPNPVISKFSTLALGMFGDPSAELRLELIFHDPKEDVAVRSSAADGLCRIGTDNAIIVLGNNASLPGTPALQAKCRALLAAIGADRVTRAFLPLLLNECSRPAADALDLVGWRPAGDGEKTAYCLAKGLLDECAKMPEAVIAALSSSGAGARAAAATALGKIKAPGAVDALLPVLGNPDEKVRKAATEALAALGEPAVGPLAGWIKTADPNSKTAAMYALARIGVTATGSLAAALEGMDYYTLGGVIQELELKGWKPERSAGLAAYWAWKCDREACLELGAPAAKAMVGFLPNYSSQKYEIASAILLRMVGSSYGPDIVEYLLDRLPGRDGSANYVFSKVVVKSGAVAVDPLCARLASGDPAARKAVLETLGEICKNNRDIEAYGRIARHLPGPLADRDRSIHVAAANVACTIGPGITDEVARAKVFECLEPYLFDRNDNYFAVRTLEAMGWKPGNNAAAAYYWIAQKKYDRCVDIGEPAVWPLNELIGSQASVEAIAAAGKIGDERFADTLLSCLNSNKSFRIRQEAAKALVTMYTWGKLDDDHKQQVLALRGAITRPHADNPRHSHDDDGHSSNDCGHGDRDIHLDEGIGVDFPLL